jgi:DNA-binding transcriptional LysR family regulator
VRELRGGASDDDDQRVRQRQRGVADHPCQAAGVASGQLVKKRMAEAGFGLAILPESSLEEELRTGTPRAIDAPALTASVPVAPIRRRNAFQTGAARALTAALTDWPVPHTQPDD